MNNCDHKATRVIIFFSQKACLNRNKLKERVICLWISLEQKERLTFLAKLCIANGSLSFVSFA